jgi:hypothetical protein
MMQQQFMMLPLTHSTLAVHGGYIWLVVITEGFGGLIIDNIQIDELWKQENTDKEVS